MGYNKIMFDKNIKEKKYIYGYNTIFGMILQ